LVSIGACCGYRFRLALHARRTAKALPRAMKVAAERKAIAVIRFMMHISF